MDSMVKNESVIVSLTTWSARIGNIPVVLDTIFAQTMQPDKVVLNLAYGEEIPELVQKYIEEHRVEVFRTEDTKVYKKFIPTLKRYKDACVINVDDDLLYPNYMIEDFWNMHVRYPNNPICGNHSFCQGRMCHCGEASLTKYEFFGDYLDWIDADVIKECTSSDLVFTYLATKAGHPYLPSKEYYGTEYTKAYNSTAAWTGSVNGNDGIRHTMEYMEKRFGALPELFSTYVKEPLLADAILKVSEGLVAEQRRLAYYETEKAIRNSRTYRLGRLFIIPVRFIRKLFGR